jgi:hypothetical protein
LIILGFLIRIFQTLLKQNRLRRQRRINLIFMIFFIYSFSTFLKIESENIFTVESMQHPIDRNNIRQISVDAPPDYNHIDNRDTQRTLKLDNNRMPPSYEDFQNQKNY